MTTPRVLDGNAIATQIKAEVSAEVERLGGQGIRPGLAAVLVGHVAASEIYVRSKVRTCEQLGIYSDLITPPDTVTTEEMLELVAKLNAREDIDGILIQLPLPEQVNAKVLLDAVSPAKDVDGFHPINVGRLHDGTATLVPCTPLGVMKLLADAGVALRGARALVLGRSAIVGKPVAALLTAADATVTIAHSRTRDLPAECRRAEVLVAAVGRPEMVRGDWIRPGAVVIDVGINRLADGRLVGDVAYEEAASVAGAITPVPGGVGPMTIACLLENTLKAAVARRGG